MLALGVKLWFDPDAEFSVHSCAEDEGIPDGNGACSSCRLKDLADCPEQDIDQRQNSKT